MSEPTTPDGDEEMLARLAEFDLAAAERVHGRLMAAEESSEIAELGRTYQRVARSLRQTLALKAKLKRDREAAAKDAPKGRPGGLAVTRRIRELRQAVTRVRSGTAAVTEFPPVIQSSDSPARPIRRFRLSAVTRTTRSGDSPCAAEGGAADAWSGASSA